jgi:hypothetical protein
MSTIDRVSYRADEKCDGEDDDDDDELSLIVDIDESNAAPAAGNRSLTGLDIVALLLRLRNLLSICQFQPQLHHMHRWEIWLYLYSLGYCFASTDLLVFSYLLRREVTGSTKFGA